MAETIPPPNEVDRDFGTRLDEAYKNTTYKNGIRAGLIRLLAEQIRLREQAEAALLARNIEIDALWKGDDDRHCADMQSSEQCTERYMLMRQRAEQAEDRVEVLHQLLEKAEEGSHFAEQRLADLMAYYRKTLITAARRCRELEAEVHECPQCGRACKQCQCTERQIEELAAKCEAQEIALKGMASGMIEPRVAELEAEVERLRGLLARADVISTGIELAAIKAKLDSIESDAKAENERLRADLAEAVDVLQMGRERFEAIDKQTPWRNLEPAWWLAWNHVDRVAAAVIAKHKGKP